MVDNPALKDKLKAQDHKYYLKKKLVGKVKSIADMTEREARRKRKLGKKILEHTVKKRNVTS